MKKIKHPHLWVICSTVKRTRGVFGEDAWGYWARRTSLKNPRFVTTFHSQVKWFGTKDEALRYFYAKSRKGFSVSGFRVKRKKLFLDKRGKYDYWKNRENLLK